MRETARASLLGFAIAASAAVVPLLLVVLLGLGRVVPVVQGEDASNHISVRQIAALKTFEHAIVRRDRIGPAAPSVEVLASQLPECAREWGGRADAMDRVRGWLLGPADPSRTSASRVSANLAVLDEALLDMSGAGNRRVVDAVGFDVMRWAEAGRRALATPVEAPRYPGRRFSVRCADLASAAALISRARGRMLATLAWRGTEVERTTAQWRPEQYVAISARHLARTNPWEGVPGCVYLLRTDAADGDGVPAYFLNAARASSERVCNQPAMFSASGESTASTPEPIGGDTGANFAADDPRWQVPPSIHLLL